MFPLFFRFSCLFVYGNHVDYMPSLEIHPSESLVTRDVNHTEMPPTVWGKLVQVELKFCLLEQPLVLIFLTHRGFHSLLQRTSMAPLHLILSFKAICNLTPTYLSPQESLLWTHWSLPHFWNNLDAFSPQCLLTQCPWFCVPHSPSALKMSPILQAQVLHVSLCLLKPSCTLYVVGILSVSLTQAWPRESRHWASFFLVCPQLQAFMLLSVPLQATCFLAPELGDGENKHLAFPGRN